MLSTHTPQGTLRFIYSQYVTEAFDTYGPLLGAGHEVALPRHEIRIEKLPEMYRDMLYMQSFSQKMRARRMAMRAEKARAAQKLPAIQTNEAPVETRLNQVAVQLEETPPDTRGSTLSLAMTSMASSMECVSPSDGKTRSQEKLPAVFMTSTRTPKSSRRSR